MLGRGMRACRDGYMGMLGQGRTELETGRIIQHDLLILFSIVISGQKALLRSQWRQSFTSRIT